VTAAVEALQREREEQGSDGGGGAIEGHLPRVDERYCQKGAALRGAAAKDEADREQRRAAAEAEAVSKLPQPQVPLRIRIRIRTRMRTMLAVQVLLVFAGLMTESAGPVCAWFAKARSKAR
jgi:hypothetical protein